MHMEECRDEEYICHDPGKRAGKAGTQKADRRYQGKGNNASRQHFHNACKDGENGKSHALNEKTHDVDQSQREIKAGLDQQESPGICYNGCLVCGQE